MSVQSLAEDAALSFRALRQPQDEVRDVVGREFSEKDRQFVTRLLDEIAAALATSNFPWVHTTTDALGWYSVTWLQDPENSRGPAYGPQWVEPLLSRLRKLYGPDCEERWHEIRYKAGTPLSTESPPEGWYRLHINRLSPIKLSLSLKDSKGDVILDGTAEADHPAWLITPEGVVPVRSGTFASSVGKVLKEEDPAAARELDRAVSSGKPVEVGVTRTKTQILVIITLPLIVGTLLALPFRDRILRKVHELMSPAAEPENTPVTPPPEQHHARQKETYLALPAPARLLPVSLGPHWHCVGSSPSVHVHWVAKPELLPLMIIRNTEMVGTASTPEGDFNDHDVRSGRVYTYRLARREANGKMIATLGVTTETMPDCRADNHPPVVSVYVNPIDGTAPLTVRCVISAHDDDKDPLTFDWNFGDGSTQITSEPEVLHTFTFGGDFTVAARVLDGHGGLVTTENSGVKVVGPVAPQSSWNPTGWAEAQKTLINAGESISFRATPRPLTRGDHPVSYRWYFGDCQLRAQTIGSPEQPAALDCYSSPTSSTEIEHTFKYGGAIEVMLEIRYDSGEVMVRDLGSVYVNNSSAINQGK